jgi:hypothetical protein
MPFKATPNDCRPRLFLPCFELARNIAIRTDTCCSTLEEPAAEGRIRPSVRRATLRRPVSRSSRSHPAPAVRRRAGAVAVAVAVGVSAAGLAACGGDDAKKKPTAPRLTAEQNTGVADIGRAVSKYCLQGGAHSNIEREVQGLLVAYRSHPTAVFRAPNGTESPMRTVVIAVAERLEACGERGAARPLRTELRSAGR